MEYRTLGRSGLKISVLSIGGWLTFGARLDAAATGRILDAACDVGINFIDLADVYANGEAERCVGPWLKGRRRDAVVVSSKAFWPTGDGPNDRGLSRKHLFAAVDGALKRLQTDHLDLFFCHREDRETPLEETVRALGDLVRSGRILYWGTSVWQPKTMREACRIADGLQVPRPIVEQPRYNLLDRWIEDECVPTARQLGMGLVVWSPLAGGLLTGKYDQGIPAESRGATSHWLEEELTEENLERLRRFSALAKTRGVSPASLALAFVLQSEGVTSAILGATSTGQLQQNLDALDVTIDPATVAELDAIFTKRTKGLARSVWHGLRRMFE